MDRIAWLKLRIASCAFWIAAAFLPFAPAFAQSKCVPDGDWIVPGEGRSSGPEVLARAARGQVVLLGETHDNADHHRWQQHTLAALAALRPKTVIGFEMFPRRVQAALDRWVAGELGEEEFLKASDWSEVWGFESALYLPLFHFARLNRIRMIALNVEREFVRTVNSRGLAAVPAEKRENVSDAVPATPAYLDWLYPIYAEHRKKEGAPSREDAEFRRFVEGQLLWDRAMAQALAENARRDPDALIVGVMGSGHIMHGYGVPRQLRDLGISRIATLIPWDPKADCKDLSADVATAVFGVAAARPGPERPLLGITVESGTGGVRVIAVRRGSIAEAAGLREGDVLVEAAGRTLKIPGEVRAIVEAMAPGTWLPLKARRQNESIEIVAKFPAKP